MASPIYLALGVGLIAIFLGLMPIASDLKTLLTIWFRRGSGKTHSERLESFYASQATTYDQFRKKFLWGREPLQQELAHRLEKKKGLIWVDLGGGTGANVEMMAKYKPLDDFAAIYVLDLCHSLCEQAKLRVESKGWKNVHVVEADATTFLLPEESRLADVVTFSYSLSMIPDFLKAVDQAKRILAEDGIIGVCDFYVSAKYDEPDRQMSWLRRFFWQMVFDLDGIHLGHERRLYLEHCFETDYERNSQGSIPFVPFLRAPWYSWIGSKRSS